MILDTLAAAAKARVAKLEKQKSLVTVRAEAEQVYHRETYYYKYTASADSAIINIQLLLIQAPTEIGWKWMQVQPLTEQIL